MTNNIDKETFSFLTNKENIEPVLEILRRGDDILSELWNCFWEGLKSYLQETQPTAIPTGSFYWHSKPEPKNMRVKYARIEAHLIEFNSLRPSLHYCIENENPFNEIRFYFGVHSWTPITGAQRELPELKAVEANEGKVGFTIDNNPHWLGWKYFCLEISDNEFEFLVDTINDPSRIYKAISVEFWPFVEESSKLLHAANTSLLVK